MRETNHELPNVRSKLAPRRWIRLWPAPSSEAGDGFYFDSQDNHASQDPWCKHSPLWQELRLCGITGFILELEKAKKKSEAIPDDGIPCGLETLKRQIQEQGFEFLDAAELPGQDFDEDAEANCDTGSAPLNLLKRLLQKEPNENSQGQTVIEPVPFQKFGRSRVYRVRELLPWPTPDSNSDSNSDSSPAPLAAPVVSIIVPFSRDDQNWVRVIENLAVVYRDVSFEVICLLNGMRIADLPNVHERRQERQLRRRQRRQGIRLAQHLRGISQGRSYLRWVEVDLRFPHFAAGICRNWGAKLANSEHLLFLDSDMLIPSSYRPWVNPEPVSMCRRRDVDCETLAPLKMETYWLDFNLHGERFLNQVNGWKYLCTHSLAVSRQLFFDLGGFAWSFQDYGHEDTEWAYRYWKTQAHERLRTRECRVHLHREMALHLRLDREANSWSRRSSLQRTGLLMLLMHPNSEVARFVQYLWGWPFRIAKKRMEIAASANSLLKAARQWRIGKEHGARIHNQRPVKSLENLVVGKMAKPIPEPSSKPNGHRDFHID